MGLRPTEGDEKRLGPATGLNELLPSPLSSRPKRPVPACRGSGGEGFAIRSISNESRVEDLLSPLSSRPKRTRPGVPWRDPRFYGPFVEMFFDGAKRFADLADNRRFHGAKSKEPRLCVLADAARSFP